MDKLQYNLRNTLAINETFLNAPAALPVLVGIGQKLCDMKRGAIELLMNHIQEHLPLIDSRLAFDYAVTMATTILVSV